MIAPSSSKDSFLHFQTKKLIRSGNREHNGGFRCLEPLEQRAFVSDYNWFSCWGRFSGGFPAFFSLPLEVDLFFWSINMYVYAI